MQADVGNDDGLPMREMFAMTIMYQREFYEMTVNWGTVAYIIVVYAPLTSAMTLNYNHRNAE